MAYTVAVTIKSEKTIKLKNNMGVGVLHASAALTNYNSALVAITAISGRFQSVLAVVPAPSSTGYSPEWVTASSAFKVWAAKATTASSVLTQLGEDVDAGNFEFIAIGLV